MFKYSAFGILSIMILLLSVFFITKLLIHKIFPWYELSIAISKYIMVAIMNKLEAIFNFLLNLFRF